MGSGKTTMSKLLADHLGLHLFEEKVAENIFLPNYYQDPKKWAFYSQIFYLREKASQISKVKNLLSSNSVIQDTPIYQDAFAYAKAQKLLGYMTDEEHDLYLKFFEALHKDLPIPDLIVQLDASVPTLESRIRQRGREYEKSITAEYLKLLSDLQEEWIANNSHLRVVRISTDNPAKNILTNESYKQEFLNNIKTAVIGRL